SKQENSPTLFDENPVFPSDVPVNIKDEQEIASKSQVIRAQIQENQLNEPVKTKAIKVKKIAIFYSDNTYEEFVPAEND
ncbi:MAG: hypothetical protein Q8914_12695, partial [Bacteroidota bacterium]|nr:hypothetical protein [Bacteroidota bacterium]